MPPNNRGTAKLPATSRSRRAVGRDPVEPRTDRRPALELLKTAPRGEQRLLEEILGVMRRPDDPVDVQLELVAIRVREIAKLALLAGTTGSVPVWHHG